MQAGFQLSIEFIRKVMQVWAWFVHNLSQQLACFGELEIFLHLSIRNSQSKRIPLLWVYILGIKPINPVFRDDLIDELTILLRLNDVLRGYFYEFIKFALIY